MHLAHPHGCSVYPDWYADHDALRIRLTEEVTWTQHMKSRHTASMGVPYNYGGASYPVMPWHPDVRALAEEVGTMLGMTVTNCLLNAYPTGQHSMGWHADDVTILAPGTPIAILSLGHERTLGLRCRADDGFHYEELPLPGGSLVVMGAEMQQHWRHRIRRAPACGPRVSLSFRQIVRWDASPPPLAPKW